ncbi:undecaprenyl-phosphate glucose phosphotransferase [Enterovirga rhinocerotis]|uniref:Undecaprenyl-phosphate glucose phosphotransferase n=1 Tax=Enterovirga rhinocerotis TaxID=1339210 RepID=A0A4V3DYW1_9HYPH|nr:undecaprenyl-phosphate glucose phosphotransferase [Enterovirga rhinocerotis]TDR94149.1 Undecaprenyl-phosphate glucose phosphotransferase [Enterovirga rhinocerotis]
MSVFHSVEPNVGVRRSRSIDFFRYAFPALALAVSAAAVLLAAAGSWLIWRLVPGALFGSAELHLRLGIGAAVLVTLFTVLRDEHRLTFYLADEHKVSKTARVWNMAFIVLFIMAFLTRRADELSRGIVVIFYFSGFLSLWAARRAMSRLLQIASKFKMVATQRLLVVGTEVAIGTFLRRHQPWNLGFEVVGTISLDGRPKGSDGAPSREFMQAIERARALNVDDVYIAVPWSNVELIDLCVEAFLNTPTTIHLAPERVLNRFDQVSISRVGAMASLELTRPMSAPAVALKRAFDLVLAIAGLVVLAPFFAVVALAIKLDSPGPVFFFQTRYGFNHRRFRIVKFRTMSTFSDDAHVPQARANDPRITRIGAWLRRTNIDELPQLLNVVAGQMSLVGPRPHAVPHNREYERRIARYARRHNVRPGITGWAQVNGLRGETDTEDKMRRRVEYDLYYIDNWSPMLDLRILFRTIFSAKAYRNAR